MITRPMLRSVLDRALELHRRADGTDSPKTLRTMTVAESEWATDVGFGGGVELQRPFPLLVEHGMLNFSSPDGMKFRGIG